MTTDRVRSALAAGLLVLIPALGSGDILGEVTAAHDARIAATIRGDVAALASLMTDDATYTHSSGVTERKAEFLAALRNGTYVYRAIEPRQRRIRVYGEATAVLSGPCRVVIEPAGRRTEIELFFTEVYVKQGRRWRMALWHSTRLPAASSPVARPAPLPATVPPPEAPAPASLPGRVPLPVAPGPASLPRR